MKVRVVRPLCIAGQRREVGEIVDLPRVDAMGAVHIGRAELVAEQAPAPGPMTTESVAAEPAAEPQPAPKKKGRKAVEEQT